MFNFVINKINKMKFIKTRNPELMDIMKRLTVIKKKVENA